VKAINAEQTSIKKNIKQLDVVALTESLPDRGLTQGQVGTVVEELAPDVFEVEFCDNQGRTYATLSLNAEQLIVLHYEPAFAVGA
jgi:hypothetical protein